MSLYEFRCRKCGQDKEVLIFSGGDVKAIWCDSCGGTMTKVMSAPAIVYKLKADYV